MEEESWRRNHGGGIIEEESWRSNHGGGIMEEEPCRRHLRSIWEASERRLGGIWEASGRLLGGIWEAPGRLGGPLEANGVWEAKWTKSYNLSIESGRDLAF